MRSPLLDPDQKPGKKNRLKVGQRVTAKSDWLDWHLSHLNWLYGVAVNDDKAYDPGQSEIRVESLSAVFFLIHHHLSNKMPRGIVFGYAAFDDIVKGRKNVRVEFSVKTDLGIIKYTSICSENQLNVVKNKKIFDDETVNIALKAFRSEVKRAKKKVKK